MSNKTVLGWPVVTARNCFGVIRENGIVPWSMLPPPPEPLNEYLAHATEAERVEFERFGPKCFVERFEDPRDKSPFNGFRTIFKPCVVVFAVIPYDGVDYVPVTAEWKHGNGRVTIVPVAGVPGKEEVKIPTLAGKMRATAYREWEEETGTCLASVTPLSPSQGVYSAVRNAEIQCFPFLGKIMTPFEKGPTKFDSSEQLIMVVFSLAEWLKLIESSRLWDKNPEFGLEMCTRDVTYAALRAMGRLRLS